MKHLGDITKISGHNAPPVDVIIGGSPCQDLSVAGKRAGLCRMNGLRYTLPESGRCDHGHYKAEKKCPVCGQSVNAEETIRALVVALVRCRDLCDICANNRTYPGPECYESDYDCSACESNCTCARCENGSNFQYGGTA